MRAPTDERQPDAWMPPTRERRQQERFAHAQLVVTLVQAAEEAERAEHALESAKDAYVRSATEANLEKVKDASQRALRSELVFHELWERAANEWFTKD